MRTAEFIKTIESIAAANTDRIKERENHLEKASAELAAAKNLMQEAIATGDAAAHADAEHKISFLEAKIKATEAQPITIAHDDGLKLYADMLGEYTDEKDRILSETEKAAQIIIKSLDALGALEREREEIVISLLAILPEDKRNAVKIEGMNSALPRYSRFIDEHIKHANGSTKTLLGWVNLLKG